jgi:integrase
MSETRGKNKNLLESGNPRLLRKPVKDGNEYSLYLEYQIGYNHDNGTSIRRKESLSLYLVASPRTPVERQKNKETLDLAKKIRFEREQEFLEDKEGYRLKKDKTVNFYDYYQAYVDNYTKKDIRVIEMGLRDFKAFTAQEYPQYAQRIEPKQITKDMMIKFTQFLTKKHRGTGISSVYRRFKKIINYGIDHGVFTQNPCKGVTVAPNDDMLVKEILSEKEMKQLFACHYEGENPIIRRAFAMTCLGGIRYCDVKRLTYGEVDYENALIKFRQNKTINHSKRSGAVINLTDITLAIIGPRPEDAKDDTLIFPLPSSTMCLKALRHWTKRAGITKHITWHCGRHSFGTILLNKGSNVKVVADLLGHSSLKYVEVYVRAVDEEKKKALNSLPKIDIF